MKKLSLAYLGTPDFSARFLEKILSDKELPVEVKLVVTQKDKKVGRKQILTPSPVKLIAQKHGISVETGPVTSSTRFHEFDLALLFAYGEIISEDLLKAPKYGFWNIHPSLLPKYRGASPVAFPLINGDNETGVTIIQMDKELDHGPIIAQERVPILPKERKDELTNRLTDVAFDLFKRTVHDLISNQIRAQVQDDENAIYTKLLTKQDGYVEMEELRTKSEEKAEKLFNKFRGFYPWPGLWATIRFKNRDLRLKITDMDLVNGRLIIKKVQLEGKNESNFEQFKRVYL